jgi:Mn2+/Fe2+ NRAMP family transporter
VTLKKAPASAEEDNDGFLKRLGPGLITGASDDDPSGIGTYSQAGAQLGFGVGWTMLLTYPLMVAIQEISGRIGRITGHGIAGNVCRNFGGPAIWSLVVLLFAANAINIAADLGAMGDALKLVVGGSSVLYVIAFALVSVLAQVFLEYKRYVAILKWLTLVLFAYVVALFVVKVPWLEALKGLLVPTIQWNGTFLTTLVAVLGTTISPYLFVWQSSQEAEQQRIDPAKRPLKENSATKQREMRRIRIDTMVGMAFSNIIAISDHHHGSYAAREGRHRHSVLVAGGGGPQAHRRSFRRDHIRARHHRHGTARNTRAGGIHRVRNRRGTQMAGRPVAQTEAGRSLLFGAGALRRSRSDTQFHAP